MFIFSFPYFFSLPHCQLPPSPFHLFVSPFAWTRLFFFFSPSVTAYFLRLSLHQYFLLFLFHPLLSFPVRLSTFFFFFPPDSRVSFCSHFLSKLASSPFPPKRTKLFTRACLRLSSFFFFCEMCNHMNGGKTKNTKERKLSTTTCCRDDRACGSPWGNRFFSRHELQIYPRSVKRFFFIAFPKGKNIYSHIYSYLASSSS